MNSLCFPSSFLLLPSPTLHQSRGFLRLQPHHHSPFSTSFSLLRSQCSSQPNKGTISVANFEDLAEKDWSFLDYDTVNSPQEQNQKANRIISAGQISETSSVLVSIGTVEFVDLLVDSSPCQHLLVVHDSLFALAEIKEKHDKVKCWQGEIIYVPEKWAPFDVLFLCYLPALPFELDQVFGALAQRCSPGARLIISYPQGREVVEQQQKEYPDVVVSDLPDKMTLEKVAAGHSFDITEFVDEPGFYLAVLKFSEVPSKEQVDALSKELRSRASVPDYVFKTISSLPVTAHPMTQFAVGVMALQAQSEFHKAYEMGISKSKLWEPTYEDSLNLIAQVPIVASFVYRRVYKDGQIIPVDDSLDYAANYSHMLGFDNPKMQDVMRLFVMIHSDHEGGNASSHTGHIVGSALSDPYLSFAAALNALAGPRHGSAIQEALLWMKSVIDEYGENITTEQLTDYVWKTLNSGRLIPGFGHGVLRKIDPRYISQREFALKHLPHDPIFQLISKLHEVVPPILTQLGKVKNPWPNLDVHSGALLNHFGLTEIKYYTVPFGVSRTLGLCSQLIWDRALDLPLERPKSVTMEWLDNYCKKAA